MLPFPQQPLVKSCPKSPQISVSVCGANVAQKQQCGDNTALTGVVQQLLLVRHVKHTDLLS